MTNEQLIKLFTDALSQIELAGTPAERTRIRREVKKLFSDLLPTIRNECETAFVEKNFR